MEEDADALILEVGVGGRYDATNVVPAPLACGITRLDLEHTDTLGDTIGKIAWEKGGIVKPGVRMCVVGEQAPGLEAEALPVLEGGWPRVVDIHVCAYFNFRSIPLTSSIPPYHHLITDCARAAHVLLRRVKPLPPTVALGMVGDFQRGNAAVAVALAHQLLAAREGGEEEEQEGLFHAACAGDGVGLIDMSGVVVANPVIQHALAACNWPGRCQRVSWGGCHLHIDGAHTEQSMRAAVAWYDGQMAGKASDAKGQRCLVFHCGEEKAVGELLGQLVGGAPEQQPQQPRFGLVVFCPVASARPTLAKVRPARELLLTGTAAGDETLAAICDALEEEATEKGEASGQEWQWALHGAWRVLQAAHLLDGSSSRTLDSAAARSLLAEADAHTRTVVCPSVAAALKEVAARAGEGRPPPEVLVTGSLYLVGNVLSLVAEE